jgi:hydrogenase maturation protease
MLMRAKDKILLVGLGHPYRSDDGFGPQAIEALKKKFGDQYEYRQHSGDPADLMDLWEQRSLVILDAWHSADPRPGTIHCIKVKPGDTLPGAISVSSHALSLGEALEMGQILQKTPQSLIILGVEGENFEPGNLLSPAVEKALDQVIARIPQLIEGV